VVNEDIAYTQAIYRETQHKVSWTVWATAGSRAMGGGRRGRWRVFEGVQSTPPFRAQKIIY